MNESGHCILLQSVLVSASCRVMCGVLSDQNTHHGAAAEGMTLSDTAVLCCAVQDLHAAATSENLKGEGIQGALALFDTNTELWTGRIAMLGITGLFVTEAITGKVLF